MKLVAEFAGYRPEDASPPRVAAVVDQDGGVVVKQM